MAKRIYEPAAWVLKLGEGRAARDDAIEQVKQEFEALVVEAYNVGGLSIADVRVATGLSTNTIREMLKRAALTH